MDISKAGSLTGNELSGTLEAFTEDLRPWGKRMLTLYTLANFGAWIALITPIAITLAIRVAQIDPTNKTTNYGLILGVGSFAHLFVGPIMGVISDRTTLRLGMRRPWIIIGNITGFLSLLLIAVAGTVPMIMLGWSLVQITFSITNTGLGAMVADQVPVNQRGRVSGLVGMSQQVGTALGIIIAGILGSNRLFLAFMIPAALGLITILLLSIFMPDRQVRREDLDPFHVLDFVKSFWVNPRKNPDFAWVWLGRFLVMMATSFYGNYALYFLIDRLHYTLAQVPMLQLYGVLISLFTTTAAAIVSGILSDRLKKRKPFVIVATLLYAVGVVVIAFSTSFTVYLIGGALAGIAGGAYAAVDMALVTQVLPNKEEMAKDLGVFGIAILIPQSLAPAIAPLFLAIGGGGNYTALYLIAGLFFVAGALVIRPIKSVA